ncbi:fatty-acid amide hydrolase 1-like isoform X2 [Ambystoma mexicanum]|uniref:fatty-acid amide hydrolase 1-like isoform X2 n=1 Tax=Ambystoma mexicanum TaxID=8296 RepID=UPI0037E92C1C
MEVQGLEVASLPALLLGGTATALLVLVLRWSGRNRRAREKMERAKQRREAALERMERAAGRFRLENPGVDPGTILSLSLAELTEKLQDDSLSPESVLYTYMAKGHDSTMGLVQFLSRPVSEDSVVVQVLKKQGAVPFVKTNIPQSMLNYGCSNLIFGQTVNPRNHRKTPGGSSGGEAALISSGGSILGMGSDVAGSIRLPSSFCGICGFKPTGNRISKQGMSSSSPGQKTVVTMLGPMARDVESLTLCMRALLCEAMFRLDPTVPPLPFNEEIYSSSRPLRVGYYDTDGLTMPSPSMRRAVLEMKQALENAGHTLVSFTPPRVEYATIEVSFRGLMADGGSTFLDKFKGDLVDPNLKEQITLYRIPNLIKRFLSFLLRPLLPRFSYICKNVTDLGSVKALWKHHGDAENYRLEFLAKWKALDLDVMLCPVLSPAVTIGYPGKLSIAVSYTVLYNLLDCPAGVVPVTTVTNGDEEELKHYEGYYKDRSDKLFRKAVEGSVGLPVAVQCVALPWQEELCLRFMKEVETLARNRN